MLAIVHACRQYTNDVIDNPRSNKYKMYFYYLTHCKTYFVCKSVQASQQCNDFIYFTHDTESQNCLKLYLLIKALGIFNFLERLNEIKNMYICTNVQYSSSKEMYCGH